MLIHFQSYYNRPTCTYAFGLKDSALEDAALGSIGALDIDHYFERAVGHLEESKIITWPPSFDLLTQAAIAGTLTTTMQRTCDFIVKVALLEASLRLDNGTIQRDRFSSLSELERFKTHVEKRLDDFSEYIKKNLERDAHETGVYQVSASLGSSPIDMTSLLAYDCTVLHKRLQTHPILVTVQTEVQKAKGGNIAFISQSYGTIYKVAVFTKDFNWPLIIASIVCPLIPLILLIASAILHNKHMQMISAPPPLPYKIQRLVPRS